MLSVVNNEIAYFWKTNPTCPKRPRLFGDLSRKNLENQVFYCFLEIFLERFAKDNTFLFFSKIIEFTISKALGITKKCIN